MSVQRPGLAVFLALGTAAVYPSRMFGYRESFPALKELVKGPSLLLESLILYLGKSSTLRSSICAV